MATPNFFRDGNGAPLVDPAGLRRASGSAGVLQVSLGAAVAEQTLSGLSLSMDETGSAVVRLCADSNGAYYAFGPASSAPSGSSQMIRLPPNIVEYVRLDSTDKSLYHLQLGTGGTLQVVALS